MNQYTHKLSGCSPAPLANYLKALGILRLVSEQTDPTALNLAGKQRNVNIFIEFMLGILKFTIANIVESRKTVVTSNTLTKEVDVSVNVSVKDRILDLVARNPQVTVKQMATALSLTERTIYRHIKNLRSEGALTRVGADKTGHWQIISNLQNEETTQP